MRRSREMIAIVVLASALAADGSFWAAPTNQTAAASTIAGRLVQRISAGLRRTIASTQFLDSHSSRGNAVDRTELFTQQVVAPRIDRSSPNLLPLPPPTI